MAWFLPAVFFIAKWGGAGTGIWAGNKLMRKGEEMLDEAGGLAGVADGAQDLLSRMDVLDLFGTKAAAHEAELTEAEAKRVKDIQKAKRRERTLERKLERLKKTDARGAAKVERELAELRAQGAQAAAHVDQVLRELEERHRRELAAATTPLQRRISALQARNFATLRQAVNKAQEPSAAEQLKSFVSEALQLVKREGIAPNAELFQQQGVSVETGDLDSIIDDGAMSGPPPQDAAVRSLHADASWFGSM